MDRHRVIVIVVVVIVFKRRKREGVGLKETLYTYRIVTTITIISIIVI